MSKEDWLVIMDIINNLERAINLARQGYHAPAEIKRAKTLATRAFQDAPA